MSEFILGSMCLTTLIQKAKEGHSAFTKSPSNGKVYFNYAEWINDEPNQFGNHSSILLSSTKDRKELEGKVYIGNGKKFGDKPMPDSDLPGDNWDGNVPIKEPKKQEEKPTEELLPKDDLPF